MDMECRKALEGNAVDCWLDDDFGRKRSQIHRRAESPKTSAVHSVDSGLGGSWEPAWQKTPGRFLPPCCGRPRDKPMVCMSWRQRTLWTSGLSCNTPATAGREVPLLRYPLEFKPPPPPSPCDPHSLPGVGQVEQQSAGWSSSTAVMHQCLHCGVQSSIITPFTPRRRFRTDDSRSGRLIR